VKVLGWWMVTCLATHFVCGELLLFLYVKRMVPHIQSNAELAIWLQALDPLPLRYRQMYGAFVGWPLVAMDVYSVPGSLIIRVGAMLCYICLQGSLAVLAFTKGLARKRLRRTDMLLITLPFLAFLCFCFAI
jgi:hypothetical protein